jgi:hypothetical protein
VELLASVLLCLSVFSLYVHYSRSTYGGRLI